MERGITALSLEPVDFVTCIDVAASVGYKAIELTIDIIDSFLAQGHDVGEIAAKLADSSIRCNLIGAIENVDLPRGPQREELCEYFRRMCEIAQAIGCPGIQVVSGMSFADSAWETIRDQTAIGVREMAEIAGRYGVQAVFEPLAWVPVCNTTKALEVIQRAECSNLVVLVDTFQIFAGADDLAVIQAIDPSLIGSVHFGDCGPRELDVWSDDDRYTMPGDGIVPLRRIFNNILMTGYDGVISDELLPPRYTSWSRLRLAETLKAKADSVLASL